MSSQEVDRQLKQLINNSSNFTYQETITLLSKDYLTDLVQLTSFSIEDQVITHLLVNTAADVSIATIDTGRLPQATYDLLAKTREKYQCQIKIYFPEAADVEDLVNENGPNAFYQSLEQRKACCHVRKVKPLERILQQYKIWVTGLRQEHSVTRTSVKLLEWDEERGMLKFNPLYNWSEKQVWDFIHENNIPYSKLYDQGYASIGCEPCTRAIKAGEPVRAGRWWWESEQQKECGLHLKDGKLVRIKQ